MPGLDDILGPIAPPSRPVAPPPVRQVGPSGAPQAPARPSLDSLLGPAQPQAAPQGAPPAGDAPMAITVRPTPQPQQNVEQPQPIPNADDVPPGQNRIDVAFGQRQDETAGSLAGRAGDLMNRNVLGEDPAIDYAKGAPVSVRSQLMRADNPDEAARVLKRYYGEGKFGQDTRGRWWIEDQGQKRAVIPTGLDRGVGEMVKNAGAGLMATSPATMGSLIGGTAGLVVGGPAGAAIGAVGGAAGGKLIDDTMKWAEGLFSKTASETAGGAAKEAAIAGAGELLGPVARGAAIGGRKGIEWLAETTASGRQMTRDLLSQGARPPIASVAPGAKVAQFRRELRNKVTSDPNIEQNIQALDKRLMNIMEAGGVPEHEIPATIKRIEDSSSAISGREAGEKIVEQVSTARGALEHAVQQTRSHAERLVADTREALRRVADPSATLASDIEGGIRQTRQEFSARFQDVYRMVDGMTGNTPIVPTGPMVTAARELMHDAPPNSLPPRITNLLDPQLTPSHITFEQAHNYRSVFREAAENGSIAPGTIAQSRMRDLAEATHEAILTSGEAGGVAGQAVTALREADSAYRRGVAQFYDATVNKLVKNARAGLNIEPEKIAATIMNPEKINTARQIQRMVPPAVWQDTLKAYLKQTLDRASQVDRETGVSAIKGKRLLDTLENPATQKVFNAFYPSGFVNELRTQARALAAFDGAIDPTALRDPGALSAAVRDAARAQRQVDRFVAENPLAALTSADPKAVDTAVRMVTTPGNEAMTEAAIQTLGANSPEVRKLRQYVLEDVFNTAMGRTAAGARKLESQPLEAALSKYTDKQQKLLFPDGLDDDIRLLIRESRFLFPDKNSQQVGLVAAGATLKKASIFSKRGWEGYGQIAKDALIGYMIDRPEVARFVAKEINREPRRANGLMRWMTQAAVSASMQGPGTGAPSPQSPPAAPGGSQRLPAPARPSIPVKTQERAPALGYGGSDL